MTAKQRKHLSILEYGRKFENFWSSVSAVRLEEGVSDETVKAIVRGMEAVELPEVTA